MVECAGRNPPPVRILDRNYPIGLCWALFYVRCKVSITVEKKSKVLKKWQVVIPKVIREEAGVEVGDYLTWRYESGKIEVIPPRRIESPVETLYGLIPSREDAVREVRKTRRKRMEKLAS